MTTNSSVFLHLPGATPPPLAIEVLPRGLTIHRLILNIDGQTHDIVIGPEKPEDHVTQKYTNTVIGRYSNRIPVGKHMIERNGIRSEFEAQANENPQVSLHGGPTGFDSVLWTVLPKGETPKLFSQSELSRVQALPEEGRSFFRLISPDGDQGYPGELITESLVALVPPAPGEVSDGKTTGKLGHVVIVYRSKLTESPEKTVTPVNLTQHWGFNLDASLGDGPEALSVKKHELTIKADSIIHRDELSLASGTFIPISEVPAHVHDNKPIGDKFPESGYDDYYRFTNSFVYPLPTRISHSALRSHDFNMLDETLTSEGIHTPSPTQLSSKKSGIELKFYTNQQGVMFYSNNLTTPAKGARKLIHGGSGISSHGDSYGPATAAFLEFHDPLTAFLDPKNRDGEDTLLTSDEVYNNFVRLEVSFTKP